MSRQPLWNIDGKDWPNRSASQFVKVAGLSWHIQVMGTGPVLLMLHGTGAATHSWRGLAPLLAKHFTVVAPDLPGHGFTDLRSRLHMSLPHISRAIWGLLCALDFRPSFVVGHSAGAAIALRMALDGKISPCAIVSLNGALSPFPGLGAFLFPALAKLIFLNPLAAPLLTRRAADPAAVARMIEGTGSTLDAAGLGFYQRLLRTERHVEATLAMMANWDLRPLQRELPDLAVPVTLVAADRDRAVPPTVADDAKRCLPTARVFKLAGRGHLAHEEAPETIANIILKACV
jgi:magnesium chelatase accessory protein